MGVKVCTGNVCGFSSYRLAFVAGLEKQTQLFEKDCLRFDIEKRERYFVDHEKVETTMSGEQRWAEYERLIDGGLTWKAEKFQKGFLEKIKQGTCASIHGSDWPKVKEKFLSSKGWKSPNLNKIILGSAPRRFGKSVVMGGIHMNAYALVMPNSVQAGFSTGKRASKLTLEYAYKTLIASGYQNWIKKYNAEELEIANPDDPYQSSKMYFYPSNVRVCCQKKIFFEFSKTNGWFSYFFLKEFMFFFEVNRDRL